MKKQLSLLLLIFGISAVTFLPSTAAPVKKVDAAQAKMATININTATLEQLTALPGVGKKKAAAIIEYRNKYGKFKSINDLTKVKGVGDKMLEKLKSKIKLG